MQTLRLSSAALILVAGLGAAHAATSGGNSGANSGGTGIGLPPVLPPQIVIAPLEVRSDPTLARGCWVRLFPKPNFEGQNDLTVAGPVDLPSLHTPIGDVYWRQKAESIMVGPKASVTVFEDQSYRGPSASLKPGARQAQLRQDLKLMQSIDSLKISCTGQQ